MTLILSCHPTPQPSPDPPLKNLIPTCNPLAHGKHLSIFAARGSFGGHKDSKNQFKNIIQRVTNQDKATG